MKIVNLYRQQAQQCFPDLRIVTFTKRSHVEPATSKAQNLQWHTYNHQDVMTRFARELKEFMKEVGISYGWPNAVGQMYSSSVKCIIVNAEDYSLLTLMSDEYDITTNHMLPESLGSFMVYMTDEDYEKYKDAISQVKR